MRILDNHIMNLEDKILDAGKYVQTATESLVNEGVIKFNDGTVITDPVEKADDIIKTAQEIKEMAIQYRTLNDLDNDIYSQNKKAVESDLTTTPDTDND